MAETSIRRVRRVTLSVVAVVLLFFVSAMPAWAMTLTFVRHAESQANADGVIDTSVPGPDLSDPTGLQQAIDVATELAPNNYDNIYVSNMARTHQTAAPLAAILGIPPVELAGLREISAGIFEGSSEDEGLGRIGYALGPIAWTLGLRFVQAPGAENGNEFDARVDEAIQQIYDDGDGDHNAVAFSHGATIMFWVMMNVENPDLGLLLSHQLDNVEQVVIEGSPEEGWTLVSWAGIPVAPEPSLPMKLFVDVRNLVVAPQTALYEIGQAFRTGDIGALANAVRNGVVNVARTVIGFVPDLVKDVVGSVTNSSPVTLNDTAPDPVVNTSFAARTSDLAPDPVEPAGDDNDKPKIAATLKDNEKSNGATDLSDGNKVVPGQTVTRLSEKSEGVSEEVVTDENMPEVVTEPSEPEPSEPTAPASTAGDSDADASEPAAA